MAETNPLGRSVLVAGPEQFLAERAVNRLVAAARSVAPDATITRAEATSLDVGRLMEITGSALLAEESVAVITGIDNLSADVAPTLMAIAKDVPPEVLLVCVHPGGAKGKQHADALKKIVSEVVDCPALKPWELSKFVVNEARRERGRIDEEAAQQVVDAIGNDSRALAGAVSQLLADAGGNAVTAGHVRRYFAGRADVTSFAVADDVMTGNHAGAVEKLRWALSTGVPPVLVTSALAGQFRQLGRYLDLRNDRMPEAAMAKEVGVPPWKLKDLNRNSRGWSSQAVGEAIKAVALTDAAVKGAEHDAEFALERLLLTLRDCRATARR